MLESISAIKTKTIASSVKIQDSKVSTTAPNSDNVAETQERIQLAKSRNASKSQEIAQDKIDRIAKAMDNYLRTTDKDLKIKIHNETGKIMVKVISGSDGKVIREIPSEELLNLAAKVEEMSGILFNKST